MIIGPNSLFGSRYRIERELGRGGMAVVYLAEPVSSTLTSCPGSIPVRPTATSST